MATVTLTADALAQFETLPKTIQLRVRRVFARLADWPSVSGAKPLRGEFQGSYRVRTGDYRVIFVVSADDQVVTVWRLGYRGDIYD